MARACSPDWTLGGLRRGSEVQANEAPASVDSGPEGAAPSADPVVTGTSHQSQEEEEIALLVGDMQQLLGPWLQKRIDHEVDHSMAKAAREHQLPDAEEPAPAAKAPVTMEAIGRRIDEAMSVAVTSAAAAAAARSPVAPMPRPAPAPAVTPRTPTFTAAAGEAAAPTLPGPLPIVRAQEKPAPNPKTCIVPSSAMKFGSSPKPGRITMDDDATVIEMEDDVHMSATVEAGVASPGSCGRSSRPSSRSSHGSKEPPTLLVKRGDSKRTLGETSVWTGTSIGARTLEDGNKKALVVNFRRLIEIKEKLDIIHEVLKATTIALLTLLAVNAWARLLYDLGFLICGIILYALHEMSHDSLDIDDYSKVVSVLGNDGDDILRTSPLPSTVDNPNRCIQALSFSRAGRRSSFSALLLSVLVVVCTGAWSLILNFWMADITWYGNFGLEGGEIPDIEHYVTLLLVGTLMLICHFVYEGLFAREFKYVMPLKNGTVWNLERDGVPKGNLNWLFGLPSVWFSTREAYEDLRIWVTLAAGCSHAARDRRRARANGQHGHRKGRHEAAVWQVFFEEMAVYALQDMISAARLRHSLLSSKLYDKQTKRFMRRRRLGEENTKHRPTVIMTGLCKEGKSSGREEFFPVEIRTGGVPAELEVELLFYDNRSGAYFVPQIPLVAEDGPARLRHQASV